MDRFRNMWGAVNDRPRLLCLLGMRNRYSYRVFENLDSKLLTPLDALMESVLDPVFQNTFTGLFNPLK
jgi:hypothetical protein